MGRGDKIRWLQGWGWARWGGGGRRHRVGLGRGVSCFLVQSLVLNPVHWVVFLCGCIRLDFPLDRALSLPFTLGSARFFPLNLACTLFTTLPLHCLLYQLAGFSLACSVFPNCSMHNLLALHVFLTLMGTRYLSPQDTELSSIPFPLPFCPCSSLCPSSIHGRLPGLAHAEVKNKLFAMVPDSRINSWESWFIFNLWK